MNEHSHKLRRTEINRLVIFFISAAVITASCMLHGIFGGVRADKTFDDMITSGNLTGKFWRVIDIQNDRITVAKYKKKITLLRLQPGPLEKGDRVSFVARNESLTGLNSDTVWRPVKIRIHGKSSFKFGISFISASIVIIMCLRYIRFDRKSYSLLFTREPG
jgi:hypothetical protein